MKRQIIRIIAIITLIAFSFTQVSWGCEGFLRSQQARHARAVGGAIAKALGAGNIEPPAEPITADAGGYITPGDLRRIKSKILRNIEKSAYLESPTAHGHISAYKEFIINQARSYGISVVEKPLAFSEAYEDPVIDFPRTLSMVFFQALGPFAMPWFKEDGSLDEIQYYSKIKPYFTGWATTAFLAAVIGYLFAGWPDSMNNLLEKFGMIKFLAFTVFSSLPSFFCTASLFISKHGHELTHVYQCIILEMVIKDLVPDITYEELYNRMKSSSALEWPVAVIGNLPPTKEQLKGVVDELFDGLSNIFSAEPSTAAATGANAGGMSLEEAHAFLRFYLENFQFKVNLPLQDLDYSREMADEIMKYPVNKIVVAGSGVFYFPILMALIGKEVVFVDFNQGVIDSLNSELNGVRKRLEEQGKDISLNIKVITEEIGGLDIDANHLERRSFDLVTFVGLVGGPEAVGGPLNWLRKAKELLKPEAYLVIDEATRSDNDTIMRHFYSIFHDAEPLLPPDVYFRSRYGSRNNLYKVATINDEEHVNLGHVRMGERYFTATSVQFIKEGMVYKRLELDPPGRIRGPYDVPDMFVYSVDDQLRGIFISEKLREYGLSMPLLNMFFRMYLQVRTTHPNVENLPLLNLLVNIYGFKSGEVRLSWISHNVYDVVRLGFDGTELSTKRFKLDHRGFASETVGVPFTICDNDKFLRTISMTEPYQPQLRLIEEEMPVVQQIDQWMQKGGVPRQIKRVLLVDDKDVLLELYKQLLVRVIPDIEIETASSGEEALAILEKDAMFDFIITDQQMWDMTGVELLPHIRRLNHQAIIVLISGSLLDIKLKEQQERFIKADADLFLLAKPFSMHDFFTFLNAVSAQAGGDVDEEMQREKIKAASTGSAA